MISSGSAFVPDVGVGFGGSGLLSAGIKTADGPTIGFGVGVTLGFTRADWAKAETANARHNNESDPNLINKVALKRSAKFDYQTSVAVA
jgi:hypothetical protein